jgi:hypothetical protein
MPLTARSVPWLALCCSSDPRSSTHSPHRRHKLDLINPHALYSRPATRQHDIDEIAGESPFVGVP